MGGLSNLLKTKGGIRWDFVHQNFCMEEEKGYETRLQNSSAMQVFEDNLI